MSWLTIVFWIIENIPIPAIVADLEAIINLFHKSPNSGLKLAGLRTDLSSAIQQGDTDGVKSIVSQAMLVAQPPQLVGNA